LIEIDAKIASKEGNKHKIRIFSLLCWS